MDLPLFGWKMNEGHTHSLPNDGVSRPVHYRCFGLRLGRGGVIILAASKDLQRHDQQQKGDGSFAQD